jgi:hypothetical protein
MDRWVSSSADAWACRRIKRRDAAREATKQHTRIQIIAACDRAVVAELEGAQVAADAEARTVRRVGTAIDAGTSGVVCGGTANGLQADIAARLEPSDAEPPRNRCRTAACWLSYWAAERGSAGARSAGRAGASVGGRYRTSAGACDGDGDHRGRVHSPNSFRHALPYCKPRATAIARGVMRDLAQKGRDSRDAPILAVPPLRQVVSAGMRPASEP